MDLFCISIVLRKKPLSAKPTEIEKPKPNLVDYSDTEDENEDEENEVVKETQSEEKEAENEIQVEQEIQPPPLCCYPCTLKISDDCKICIFCKDKPKYGGKNKLKQKCIQRTCTKKRKRGATSTSTSTSTSTRQSKIRKGM